tara:strand:+ start:2919 stop:4175 length:1257 start_codon:yes stop_codon:yes gene_type:complete
MSREIIVGIVTSFDPNGYFNNGLHQNAFYLYKLFKAVPKVNPLLIYSPAKVKGEPPPDQSEIFGEPAYCLDLFKEKYHLDALVFVSQVLPDSYLQSFRKRGVKMATAIYGNRYVMDQETMCFGHLLPPTEKHQNYANRSLYREDGKVDATWISPHFAWQKDYIKHRYKAKDSFICPYIWDPQLLDLKYDQHPDYKDQSRRFEKNHPANRNIFCTEPNVNVLKTSLFPLLASDIAYCQDKESFGKLSLLNSRQPVLHNKKLASYLSTFDITKDKKVSFVDRYALPTITKDHKMMFHHHFENGLNYTLLECAYLGLPVVHNSEFMPELGYYYRRADLTDAAKKIRQAFLHEERDDLEEYTKTSFKVLRRFSIHNTANIRGYQTLLANLLDNKLEVELPEYIVNLENKLLNDYPYFSSMCE